MSGPKAEAILSRSSDPTIKKRKKKPKNEDYVSKLESGEGLKMRDEDEWKGGEEDIDMSGDGDDAPSASLLPIVSREKGLICSNREIISYVSEIEIDLVHCWIYISPTGLTTRCWSFNINRRGRRCEA